MNTFNKIASIVLIILIIVFANEIHRQNTMNSKILNKPVESKQLVDITPTNDIEEHVTNNIAVLVHDKLATLDSELDVANIKALSFSGKENDGYTYQFHLTLNKNGKLYNRCTAEITYIPLNNVYDVYIPLNCYSF